MDAFVPRLLEERDVTEAKTALRLAENTDTDDLLPPQHVIVTSEDDDDDDGDARTYGCVNQYR